MADYSVSFSEQESNALETIAQLHGSTAAEFVQSVGYSAVKSQALQYLDEEAKNKVNTMNVLEKISFLTE